MGASLNIRRFLSLILSISLCLSTGSIIFATNDDISDVQVIKIGYLEGDGTFNLHQVQGSEGYGYEYYNGIIQHTQGNYEIEFVECTGDTKFDMLKNGEVDLLTCISAHDMAENSFLYSTIPFASREVYLTNLATTVTPYNDLSFIDNSTIAIPESSSLLSYLEKFIETNNLNVTLVDLNTSSYLGSLTEKLYDYAVGTSMSIEIGLKPVAGLGVQDVYCVASEENQALMDDINYAMQYIDSSILMYQEQLYLKYFAENIAKSTVISTEQYELLHSQDSYIVAVTDNYIPFSYFDSKGEISGFSVDVMDEIASQLGINATFVIVDSETESSTYYDMSMSLTQSTLDANVSESYYQIPFILVYYDVDQFNFQKLGIPVTYGEAIDLFTNVVTGFDLSIYDDIYALKDAFSKHEIDGMLLTSNALNMLRNDIDYENFYLAPIGTSLNLRITFADHMHPEKISAINSVIQELDLAQLEYSLLSHSTTTAEVRASFFDIIMNNPTLAVLFIVTVFASVLMSIVINQKRKKEALEALIDFDTITSLHTENKFKRLAYDLMKENPDKSYSILSVDIDNFKYINEVYGYETGTKVIEFIASLFPSFFGKDSISARRFSDNFIVFIESDKAEKTAMAITPDNFPDCQNFVVENLGEDYVFNLSFGVVDVRHKKDDLTNLIDCANIARAKGKKTYGMTLNRYTDHMRFETENNNVIVGLMEQAIVNQEFVMRYQPKVSLENPDNITGAEALVRWIKDGDIVPPDSFIPIFEKNGFIIKLDYYVADTVCKFIGENMRRYTDFPVISLNLSSLTLMEEDLVQKLFAILEKHNVPASMVDLEITESAMVDGFDVAIECIAQMREAGFTVSMDDFGTGVSSLNRLKDIPIDVLKIDRGFLTDTLDDSKGIAIIKNVINLATDLSLETIAEGIETSEQHILLRDLGCDIGQGFLFHRPQNKDDYLTLLEDRKKPRPNSRNNNA